MMSFFKFKYWFVVGGIIILKACGIITNFKIFLYKPIEAAASFCPLLIPSIPALTHSATNVAVYKDVLKLKKLTQVVCHTSFINKRGLSQLF